MKTKEKKRKYKSREFIVKVEGRSLKPEDMYTERSAFKQFWYAYMEGTVLHLDSRAPWQEW